MLEMEMARQSSEKVRSEENRFRATIHAPVISGTNGNFFEFVAKSGWKFQTMATPFVQEDSSLVFFIGNAASGALVAEPQKDPTKVYYLNDLGDARYRLSEVLTVLVEESDAQFIATEPRRGWYGYGATADEAILNFQSALAGELEALTEREARLGPALRDSLAQLRQVVVPRR